MIEKNNLRKLFRALKNQIIDIEIEPNHPDDPKIIEACRVIDVRRDTLWLKKQVPTFQQELIGRSEIWLVISLSQVRKIQFYPQLKSR